MTMKSDHIVAQLGGELVVDTGHGPRVTALPLLPGHTLAARPDLAGGLGHLCLGMLPRDWGQTHSGCHSCVLTKGRVLAPTHCIVTSWGGALEPQNPWRFSLKGPSKNSTPTCQEKLHWDCLMGKELKQCSGKTAGR